MDPIRFPHLGFEFLVGNGFTVFGFKITYYGILIAIGILLGALLAYHEAKRTGQKVDDYIDYTIFGLVGAIVGARIYYVIFEWDYYKNNLGQIFNIRGGGLAIYGAVIGAIIVLFIFCKIKKLRFWKLVDTMCFGLVLGQLIGRWGNFFNREVFGTYTDNIFAMQIPLKDASYDASALKDFIVLVDGQQYIQVHPTFLYESVGNLILLVLMLVFRDKKKFYGENLCRYAVGYGIIRFFVEGIRIDQLKFHGVPVSQVLSAVIAAAGLIVIIVMRIRLKGKPSKIDPIPKRVKKGKKAEEEEQEVKMETEEFEEETETIPEDTVEDITEEVKEDL